MSTPSDAASTRSPSSWIEPFALLAATVILLVWSAFDPHDFPTWWLEVLPVLVALPILVLTWARFSLSSLAYRLIFFHAAVLIVGGHYTYSKVPIGLWAEDVFNLSRNHYDRFGHLVQGFVPAILARELLIRSARLKRGAWLNFLIVSVCLAISATYELVEFMVALVGGGAVQSFLGTQGDVWDAQWDMLLALIGAIAALLLLRGVHDRSMRAESTDAEI
jgi:putative membrane protein